jgi:predicted transcriptional regulator of viral defense system
MIIYIRTIKATLEFGGDVMAERKLVMELIKKYNGLVISSEAAAAGIKNKTLQRMHQSGELERVDYGIYMDPNQMVDEYFLTQYRCKKGVFSHETALYFHELADRTPFQMMLTIPSGYNTRLLKEKEKYKFFYVAEELHSIGEITMLTSYGNQVQVYDKERTICDCLKKKDQLDSDLVKVAVKRYMKTPGADYARLLRYAEFFKVKGLVQKYMEVLT